MATEAPTYEQFREVFGGLPKDDLLEMAGAVSEIAKQLDEDGPSNDEELWWWVKNNIGVEIPRVSVCEGHDAPFKFLADAYFHRYPAILAMGNRGGGKTFLVALLHWLNSEFKPGHEGATFGATEYQSLRCYAHLKNWVNDEEGNRKPQILSSVIRETVWRSGSKVEVLSGTPEGVNGPHPQVAHGDEVELMRNDTWEESRNMAQSKRGPDGRLYPSQEILTSTRKSLHGRMQTLIDGIQNAIKLGTRPDYKLVIWCIFEIAEEVPSCQMAPEKEREARLEELGLDPCETCDCHLYAKGEWLDSTGKERKPRYLKDVCRGRLFRARGYLPYSDVVQKFQQNSIFAWEAQQECTKPETEHNYLKGFAPERHGIKNFIPDPSFGPIYQAVDWGGTNPSAVNWYQLLNYEIEVEDFYGELERLKVGTLIAFDEIYEAQRGATALAKMVKKREKEWRRKVPGFKVEARFPDVQGTMARADWKDQGLPTIWKTTRDFETQIEWLVEEWWEEDKLRYSIERCEMFPAEAQSWQRDPNTGKQVDEFNHCMSNLRYCTANIRSIRRRRSRGRSIPQAQGRHRSATVVRDTRRMVTGPMAVKDRGDQMDNWRKRLGGPGYGN